MKKLFLMLAASLTLAACGGGGNGGGYNQPGPGNDLTHNELAAVFVNALNASGAYTVSLVKSDTLQYDYVVIYDADYNEYDAINIKHYTPSTDILTFMASATIYYNLDYQPGYYDWVPYTAYDSFCECYYVAYDWVYFEETYHHYSGVTFEKATEVSKDTAKYAMLAEEQVVSSRAEHLSENFGLEVGRAKEVVRLAMAWQRAGGKNLTDADQDNYSREMLGFSITEAKAAIKAKAEGNNTPVEELVEKASAINGISVEQTNELIEKYIGQ